MDVVGLVSVALLILLWGISFELNYRESHKDEVDRYEKIERNISKRKE